MAEHATTVTAPRRDGVAGAVTAASQHGRPLRYLLAPLLVLFGGLSVAAVARSVEPRSYASTSVTAAVLDLAAGLGLLAAGGLWLLNQQRASVGIVTALAGVAWLSADWIGWDDGPAIARSAAMVAAPFLLALLIQLSVALPAGVITGRLATFVVSVAYGITAVVSLGWALWRDPFYDRACWSNCTDNAFLVHAEPDLARALNSVWLMFALAAGTLLAAACVLRLARASTTARRQLIPILTAIATVAVGQAVHAGLLLADPAEDPRRRAFVAVFYLRAVALGALAAAVAWTVQRRQHMRKSLAQLATDLGAAPPPGALQAALARSIGDDRLEVAYWLPGRQHYVDANGEPVDPHPDPTQTVASIERSGRQVAIVAHDRSLQGAHDLAHEIGAASRLAVDNERLRAQALAQVADLRASRTRIVEATDDTRRRLERNLHDGAQQRLLALSYTLQLAHADTRALGDAHLAAVLLTACAETVKALEELRDLANGIYPSILADSGLGPALVSYTDVAPLRVELVDVPDVRFHGSIETAAYLTVVEGVTHACDRGARRVVATFMFAGDGLHIQLTHDGVNAYAEALVHVGDRLGALGGRLDVSDSSIKAVIPCA